MHVYWSCEVKGKGLRMGFQKSTCEHLQLNSLMPYTLPEDL